MASQFLNDLKISSAIKAAKMHSKRVELRDGKVTGLTLRASASGSASWSVVYRETGRPELRRVTIGLYTESKGITRLPVLSLRAARIVANDYFASVRARRASTPTYERQLTAQSEEDPSPTFGHLFDLWLTRKAKKELRSWKDDEQRYRRHLGPRIGDTAIAQIARRDFAAIRDELHERSGPSESNRVVALFNRVLHWAVDADLIAHNPAARLRKIGTERPSQRHLSADGLKTFWQCLDQLSRWEPVPGAGAMGRPIDQSMATAFKLYLLTATRRKELILAHKSEFILNEQQPFWRIPFERVKNKVGDHIVPLSPTAVELVREVMSLGAGSRYMFPSSVTGEPIRPDAVTRAMVRTIARIDCGRPDEHLLAPVTPHDLRRTAGTLMSRSGVTREHRGYVLNHMTGGAQGRTTEIYDAWDHFDDKLTALLKLEQSILRIVTDVDTATGS